MYDNGRLSTCLLYFLSKTPMKKHKMFKKKNHSHGGRLENRVPESVDDLMVINCSC